MQLTVPKPSPGRDGAINTLQRGDLPVHDWYRFVLSFPPHLVRQYISSFGIGPDDLLLDPFCGTGTTLVEAKKNGIRSVGCDAHPFVALISRVKTNWSLDTRILRSTLRTLLRTAEADASKAGLHSLSFDALMLHEDTPSNGSGFKLTVDEEKLLPKGFLSQRPLERLLILRDLIERQRARITEGGYEFFLVALAHTIANGAGNFAFGPEIYRTKPKQDYDVLGHFARRADAMIADLSAMQSAERMDIPSNVFTGDARKLASIPPDISAVITSPPYPNEKDYTRTTRVESILLRIVSDKASLRQLKESLLRFNTCNIFVNDTDGAEIAEFSSIQKICKQIEERRVQLNKTSGFEKLYHKVVAHYFGGMRLHLRALKPKLRRGAKLAYVVGDQMSFLMVKVPTATLLAELAKAEGYRIAGCDLWRERVGTKVRNCPDKQKTVRVREEILLLENP